MTSSQSIGEISMTVDSTCLPTWGEGDAVVHLLLAGLGDDAHGAASGPGTGAGREAHDVAASRSGHAAAIEQVDVAGELLAGVLTRGARLQGQELVDAQQRLGVDAVELARAVLLDEDAVRLEQRFEERLRAEAGRPALDVAQVLDQHGRANPSLAGSVDEDRAFGGRDSDQDRVAVQALVALEELQAGRLGRRQQLLRKAAV